MTEDSKRRRAEAAARRSSRAKRRRLKPDDREPSTRGLAIGRHGGCWCGEPWPHDWEGKADGKPHPR